MREILFRGKNDREEWIEGFYIKDYIGTYIYDKYRNTRMQRVLPETVGQYTGLVDKNEKRIFEGDIVVLNVKGNNTICTVSWAETVAQFQLWQINTIPKTSTALNLGNYDCEIIGNIHDNPELLKGGEKE